MQKTKTIHFVVATETGDFPAVPVKKHDEALKQMPVCMKYKPDLKWRVFHVFQTYKHDGKKWIEDTIEVAGAAVGVKENLLKNINDRYPSKEEKQLSFI